MRKILLLWLPLALAGCKIQIDNPETGAVISQNYGCAAASSCTIEVGGVDFDETFVAVPESGFAFIGWKRQSRGLCGGSDSYCQLVTNGFLGIEALLSILDSDEVFYLTPEFAPLADAEAVDITDAILVETSGDCALYAQLYSSSVLDVQRSQLFAGDVSIVAGLDRCTLSSNSIPNHNFNDDSARFATNVSEVGQDFELPRLPTLAAEPTALSQIYYNAVMLNGVPLDLLSAGCYSPDDPRADADGNVAIGCELGRDDWMLDPLGTPGGFGVDAHNAHTQPNGLYHYHGNPLALFDDNPGRNGSPVIGFAADGFPVYGSYFYDNDSGQVRKAQSGYTLKSGTRPAGSADPGGNYDGMYIDDWEFTNNGDLDVCNGMFVDNQYGYYVTDTYPWVMACFSGTADPSFAKGGN
ncbi:YHYH protein [Halioglobus maricola]|uniref:YHYH protein n=1 Tax=Halioglobus maricola TaxID=2601894 RepID=A0A5P9NKA4_9GAMM|nr:YHYH protein [Halioglobus maricola]QFU76270.1 YHYH protein [Halioglobus maricola]